MLSTGCNIETAQYMKGIHYNGVKINVKVISFIFKEEKDR